MRKRLFVVVFGLCLVSSIVSALIVRFTLPATACQNSGWVTDEDMKEFERFFGQKHGGRHAR